MVTDGPNSSADSHITEPPDTYTARIDSDPWVSRESASS